MTYSEYVVDIEIYDKHNKFLFNIYSDYCLVLIDETILNLLKKITYQYNKIYDDKIDYNMIYIYNEKNYNIINDSNIRSNNILNEIIDQYKLVTNKLNTNKLIIDIFGLVKKIKLNMIIITNEINNILNFYSNTINDKLINHIFVNYIIFYYPLLNIYLFNNILVNKNIVVNTFQGIEKIQYEILELENVDDSDLIFLGDPDLALLFLIFYPEFKCEFDFNNLKNNILFLNDMFLYTFNNIKLSNSIISVILITPQIILQKGLIEKEIKKINNYKLIIKGIKNNIKFTFEFEIKKCKIFINYTNYSFKLLNDNEIEKFLNYIINILSNDFVKITYSSYNIDFFNVKSQLLKEIDIEKIITTTKLFNEYFFISKESDKSLYLKYKIGYVYTNSNILYNKIYSYFIKDELNHNVIYKLKVEYGVDDEEINNIINDIKIRLNTNREKGISISITSSFVVISGINNIDICNRIIFLVNKLLNISLKKSILIQDKKNLKIKSFDNYNSYVTKLDKYLSSKDDIYWCKACQNYGNKIRKPILYNSLPSSYIYDSLTNTYINDKKYRIIEISPGIYFGCSEVSKNKNKYIGFIKTCSLCCFKTDQFTSKSSISKKKIKSCWNISDVKNLIKNKNNYIYNYSRIVGDISKMLHEFEDYFNDSNYICKLEKIGPLVIEPEINTLIFIDNTLINPQMFDKNKKYSIYIYQNPFLHKVLYNDNNNYVDEFENTPIEQFIINCKNVYNIILPNNAYNIYFKYKNLIKSFSFIKNTFIIIFIFYNGLILYIYDKSLQFGEYINMFSDIKYVNKFEIPKFNDLLKIDFSHLNITSILLNVNKNINGFIINNNIFIIFKEINEIEFNKLTNNKYINFDKIINIFIINYISDSIKNTPLEIIIDTKVYDDFLYLIFKYNFFIFLNINENYKNDILKIIENNINIHQRYKLIQKYINHLFNDESNNKILFFKIVDSINYNFKINNDILYNYNKCISPYKMENDSCKLQLTKELLNKLLSYIINELIYNYGSIYIYISKYIDNTFSYSNNYIKFDNINYNDYTIYNGKIVGDKFIQEIYNKSLQIYRALANIYFWDKMKSDTNINRKNLGYISKSQTSLANYIKYYLPQNLKNPIEIINSFNTKFNFNISLVFDNMKTTDVNNYIIYLNIKNNIVLNISVGFSI